MSKKKSTMNIASIWDQIRSFFLQELQNVQESNKNSPFLQNMIQLYQPINPYISVSAISITLNILESLWISDNEHYVSFEQILDSEFKRTAHVDIKDNNTNRGHQIYFTLFEEILNYLLLLPFSIITEAFTKCKKYSEFRKYIKKYNRKKKIQFKGRYYTPNYIAKFIVEQTLSDFSTSDSEKNIILDLCAGTGAFTIEICRKLFEIYSGSYSNLSSIQIKKKIIKTHLRTIDVDPIATYILRIQVLLWFIESVPDNEEIIEFLSNLNKVTKIGNVLDSSDMFHEKFHYIISNPPYVPEKSNKRYLDLMVKNKDSFFYKARLDYFLHFLAYAMENISEKGKIGFIIPSYVTDNHSSSSVRKFLYLNSSNLKFFDFSSKKLFSKAPGFHSCIIVCQMGNLSPLYEKQVMYTDMDTNQSMLIPYSSAFLSSFDYMMKFTKKPDLGRIESYKYTLNHIAKIRQGVVAGPDRLRKRHLKLLDSSIFSENQGVFILSNSEVSQMNFTKFESQFLLPFYYVRDLTNNTYLKIDNTQFLYHILYLNHHKIQDSKIPNVLSHLKQFKSIMTRRRENLRGKRAWYELHWPRSPDIFQQSRIISIRRSIHPRFIYSEIPFVTDLSTNIILPHRNVDVKELFEYLKSSEVIEWVKYYAKRKGKMLQIDKSILERIPIPDRFN